MPFYRVEWCIELDADTPEEAAILALELQHDPESMATCVDVIDVARNEKVLTNYDTWKDGV